LRLIDLGQKMQLKKFKFYLLIGISFLFILSSCIHPGEYRMRDRYVVTTKSLYIRSAPSTVSDVIGSLSKGDTIIAVATDKYWVMIRDGAYTGYVSTEYLKKINYPITPQYLETIEKLANWQKWYFWLVAAGLLFIWVTVDEFFINAKHKLRRKFGFNTKGIIISHVTFFVVGILSGIIYIYWKDSFIEGLSKGFESSISSDISSMSFWIQAALILISLLIDYLGSIFISGIRFGTLLTFFDFTLGVIILIISFYFTIALSFYAITFLIIFFTARFIHAVYQNSNKFRPNRI